ncbi:MAG: hypothetical protein J5586_01050 [Clostridia bacterium]|nr:hypothetical protein [Clostridia bacterium]
MELIANNVKKAKRHALSTYSTPAGLDPHAVQSMRTTQSIVELCKYAWFYFQVKKNGPMDYKVVSRWKKALPSLLFPGEIPTYMFYVKKISASDLGNINYGAVGVAMGIPLNTLLKQAGAAQLRKPRIEQGEGRGFFSSLRRANQLGYFGHYGDQVDDFNNIILGYYLYLKGVFE